MPARALLVDFGGVLTTNVFDAFGDFCSSVGLDRDAFARAVRENREAADLLVAVETGQISESEFEEAFAPMLCRGTDVKLESAGIIERLTQTLGPDEPMLDVVARVRAAGHCVVIASNSFGMGAYDGYDLDQRADHVLLSGEVGVRKPSRRFYEMAAEACDVPPEECVFVDDLEHNIRGAERVGMIGVHHTDSQETIARLEQLFELEVPVS